MVAAGWVGMGAGLLPRGSWRVRIGALALYGFVTGFAYGAVMNLWAWPFLTTGSALAWDPSSGAAMNLRHYATFYMATSFVWDSFRAVGNAVLVLALGRPLLGALDRAARRMRVHVDSMSAWPLPATERVSAGTPSGVPTIAPRSMPSSTRR